MSHEVMAWMRMKPKNGEKNQIGFKALIELVQYNTIDIQDPRTGTTLAYLSEQDNEKLFSNINQLDEEELTLMGYGDSWSFNDAQTLIDLLIESKEQLIHDMLTYKKDKGRLTELLTTIENTNPKMEFSNIIFREEDIDVLEGFDEFVWCSSEGCKVPAEYNFKRLANGEIKGRDDFPARIGLSEEDLPCCLEHFNKLFEKTDRN